MKFSAFPREFSSRFSVFAPMVVLTLIFACLLGVLYLTDQPGHTLTRTGFIVGLAVYGIAVVLLVKFGLANVRKLESLGLTDSLSGIPNRRALHIDIARHGANAEEHALALVDLDGFKAVNDQYGHFVGDRVIKECAAILQEICGEDARCYRLGGDEFALVMMGPIAGNLLEGLCRSILARLSRPIFIDERPVTLGASIGLSRSSTEAPHSSSELLRRSDVAMYASKQGGKMRCTWFSEDFDRTREEARELDAQMRDALARGEFVLHYQPLVDARSGRIVTVEALIRWIRPDGVNIGPHVFIPVAEESGLINAIGLWVLRRACEEALGWDGVRLSVNVSAAQLRNPEFPVELGQILEETGFPASRLELEVTETYLVGDSVAAARSLDVIRSFGVGVVLDDFGTGYASIGFLRKARFEKLKIDRSLVTEAAHDSGSRAMMISSIAVARAMDMKVTAEGIETEAQAAMARAAGCDQMQGWLYFKAIPACEVSRHLGLEQTQRRKAGVRRAAGGRQ
ncbi:MAG: EAL domain-containing protein [Caenibius sp.]